MALETFAATDVVMARQPIFDADLRLAAFELLYRAVGEDGRSTSGDRATATVLVGALTDVGLARLVGSQRAYLNVDREFLLAFRPLPLPADRAFTVGLFSVADALLETTMPELLAELPFDERTAQRHVLRRRRVGHRDGRPARLNPGAHTLDGSERLPLWKALESVPEVPKGESGCCVCLPRCAGS